MFSFLSILGKVLREAVQLNTIFWQNVLSIIKWLFLKAVELVYMNHVVWHNAFLTLQQMLPKGVQLSYRFLQSVSSFVQPLLFTTEHLTLYLWHWVFILCNVVGSMFIACVLFGLQTGVFYFILQTSWNIYPLGTVAALYYDFLEIERGVSFLGQEAVDCPGIFRFGMLIEDCRHYEDARPNWVRLVARSINAVYEEIILDRDFDASPFKDNVPDSWFLDRQQNSALFCESRAEDNPSTPPIGENSAPLDKKDEEMSQKVVFWSIVLIAPLALYQVLRNLF